MRILHISDIQEGYFGIKEDLKIEFPEKWQSVYNAILNDLKVQFKKIHSEKPVDIIVISGDIASKGEKEEYSNLTREFIPMMEEVFLEGENLVPKSNWLLPPGNHDLQWGKDNQRFNEYITFCQNNGFHLNFRINEPNSIFDLIHYEDGETGKKIDFVLLNSCLDIHNKETSKTPNLSKEYFHTFEAKLDNNTPKIIICHHRLIEISNYKRNHCLEELHDRNVFLSLVGDFHVSSPHIDKISGIQLIPVGAVLAKKAERTFGIDELNREINVVDLDLIEEKISWTTYLKSAYWVPIKRDEFSFQPSKVDTQKKLNNLIIELKKIKNIIHSNHPFEDVIVRDMDKSFYNYIDEKKWEEAKNQFIFKLGQESKRNIEIMVKVILVQGFKRLCDDIPTETFRLSGIEIPEEIVAKEFRRELPIYKNSLKYAIQQQFSNLDYIARNFVSLFSKEGILLFITESQIQEVSKLKNYIKLYTSENLKESTNINLEDLSQLSGKQLEQKVILLCSKINFNKLKEIEIFLRDVSQSIVDQKNALL